jgi:hypothetical protein
MSCSSLTSCQHGHVRTLSSTDEHVFARLGWIHDPVCSVALPTAVIPFTFRACPRSAVCCRIKPYHFCIQPGPRPPVASLAPAGPGSDPPPAPPPRSPLPGGRGPRRPGGCSVRHPLRLPAPGVGRTLGRGGGGEEGTGGGAAGRGRGAGARDSRLGGNRDTSHHSRVRDCRLERPGTPPAPVTRPARPRGHASSSRPVKSVIYLNATRGGRNRQSPPAAAFGSGRACCTCCSFRVRARVRPRDWSRARAILTTDNALARLSHSSDSTRKRPREALSL